MSVFSEAKNIEELVTKVATDFPQFKNDLAEVKTIVQQLTQIIDEIKAMVTELHGAAHATPPTVAPVEIHAPIEPAAPTAVPA